MNMKKILELAGIDLGVLRAYNNIIVKDNTVRLLLCEQALVLLKENAMKKKKIRIILIAVLAGVFLVSMGMVIRQQIQYRKTIADGEEAARIAGLETGAGSPKSSSFVLPVGTGTAAPSSEETPPEEVLELAEIDLGALRAYNEDVVGWISIPGTIVSYPLVQGTDNQYYLTRNWKRESISSGSVFLDYKASPALTFIQHCMDHSVIDTGLTPEAGDRFLTLSTCTGNGFYSSRWVIHGVLAQEYRRINN